MTRVKICGIKEEVHALTAAEAGADFIGLIFAPSRRQITPEKAGKIATAVNQSGHATEVVGLFVNMPAAEVNRIAGECNLDRLQLSGHETWEYCLKISRPLIKVVHVSSRQRPEEVLAALAAGEKILNNRKHVYLLDSHVEGSYGGTGTTFDWSLARQAAAQFPVIIAGGLTPENVAEVIRTAAPWGVDVSSGVETDGVKDTGKIKAFIDAVRRADDNQK